MAKAFGESVVIDRELEITLRPCGTQLQIFDDPQGRARAAVRDALTLVLQDEVGCVAGDQPSVVVMTIGPGKWLLHAQADSALFQTLSGSGARVVDVSSGRSVIRVGGKQATRLIEMGCGLDLAHIAPGSCANTLFTQTAALIHRLAGDAGFDVYIARSLAQSIWEWMVESAHSQHANEWKD